MLFKKALKGIINNVEKQKAQEKNNVEKRKLSSLLEKLNNVDTLEFKNLKVAIDTVKNCIIEASLENTFLSSSITRKIEKASRLSAERRKKEQQQVA